MVIRHRDCLPAGPALLKQVEPRPGPGVVSFTTLKDPSSSTGQKPGFLWPGGSVGRLPTSLLAADCTGGGGGDQPASGGGGSPAPVRSMYGHVLPQPDAARC